MTALELITKLQELARLWPDAPVVVYDVDGDYVEIETAGRWAILEDDRSFVVLNHPEDKHQKFVGRA